MQTETFAPAETNQQLTTSFKDQFVGEGRKYQSEEDAFKGLAHANEHIAKVEAEAAALREKLAVQSGVEELLKKHVNPSIVQTPQLEAQKGQENTTPKTQAPEPKDVSDLVREALQQQQTEAQKATNLTQAVTTLDKVYGSRELTEQAVQKRAQELGYSVGFLKEAAETSPAGFYAMMGVDVKSQPNPNTAPMSSDKQTPVFNSNQPSGSVKPDTYAYFKELRKSDPKTFNSAATQKRMRELAMEDADKFYGRK